MKRLATDEGNFFQFLQLSFGEKNPLGLAILV